MTHEVIIQIEEMLDRLEHTRDCLSDQYYDRPCSCGVNAIKEAALKYIGKIWKENRTG